jgi:O-antigen/teichoic acid export membrane protein
MIPNIYTNYKNLSKAVKTSFWFMVCSIIQKGIAFFSLPVFTRLLSTTEYGQYAVYQSWHGIIAVFATLNLNAGIFNNGMAKFETDRDRYTSALLGVSVTATLSVFLIYFVSHSILNRLLGISTILMFFMFTDFLFNAVISFWMARQRYEFRYRVMTIVTLLSAFSSVLLGILFITTSNSGVYARVFADTLTIVCIGTALYTIVLRKSRAVFHKEYWSYALRFNIPLIPHYLSLIVLNNSDRIMIERFCGSSDAAVYSVAYNVAMVGNLVTGSINASLMPWCYQAIKNKRYDKIRKTTGSLVILIAAAVLLPILFAPEIVCLMAPKEYSNAVYVIPPVAASLFFIFTGSLFSIVIFYYEAKYFVMLSSVLSATANIILNAIFLPIYGFVAAAFTTLICYIIWCAAYYLFMKYICKKHIDNAQIFNGKLVFIISIPFIVTTAALRFLYPYALLRYGLLAAVLFVFFIMRKNVIRVVRKLKFPNNFF